MCKQNTMETLSNTLASPDD